MIIPYIIFFAGFIFMIKGGDLFVDGATWIAKTTGLPEVVIGATIVSLATTLPETMVSVLASIHNQPTMSIGNAIGSIICNTGLVLGVSSMIKPSKVHSRIFYVKGFLFLVYLFIFWKMASLGVIGFSSSLMLVAMLFLYILLNFKIIQYKNHQKKIHQKKNSPSIREVLFQIFSFIMGAFFILVGAHLLIDYGIIIAEYWKVPSAIISLTLISFGTSLPELTTSISALRKGHGALSVGNILGSNILNITLVLGAASIANPLSVSSQALNLDIPVAFFINCLLLIPAFLVKKISRFHGFLILIVYVIYISYLFVFFI